MKELTVICSKWGNAYGPEYVNRLQAMVARHLTISHDFVCFTDDPSGVNTPCRDIRPYWEGKDPHILFKMQGSSGISCGYPNLYMFRNDFPISGRILYFDLDVVIVDNIDCLISFRDDFIGIWDWWADNINGSVTSFNGHWNPGLWDDFPPADLYTLNNGQSWLSRKIHNPTTWPNDWVRSYKGHCMAGLPAWCKIVVFHGSPKPHEVDAPWIKEHWYGIRN